MTEESKGKEKEKEKPEVVAISPRKVARSQVQKIQRGDDNDRRNSKTGSRK